MLRLIRFAMIMVSVLVAAKSALATRYYINCAGGSDSNNGTSKSTPWLHAPGMQGTVKGVGPGAIDDAAGDGCVVSATTQATLNGTSATAGWAVVATIFKHQEGRV